MSKPRLPFDIDFLLESILAEDPDTVTVSDGESQVLKSKDIEVPKGSYRWFSNEGASPFFIDEERNVVVYQKGNTHGRMQSALRRSARDAYSNAGLFLKTNKIVSVKGNPVIKNLKIGFFGIPNTPEGVKDYLRDTRHYFNDLEIRGYDDSDVVLSGRIWTKRNVISFWNSLPIMNSHSKLIADWIKSLGLDPTKFAYEFLDRDGIFFAYENGKYVRANKDVDSNEKLLSPEEMTALRKKQHIDPKAKSALTGPEYKDAHLKKAGRGFPFAAAADAAMPALEGHIKLKDLINEDPDAVVSQEDIRIAKWTDGDAVAFIITKHCNIINDGGVHYDIVDTMTDLHFFLARGRISTDESFQDELNSRGIKCDNIQAFKELITTGPVADYLKKGGRNASANEDMHFRKLPDTIFGRLWNKKKIISFWNETSYVVKHWDWVKRFFSGGPLYVYTGSINDYRIDWIERAHSATSTPLTKASDVTSDTGKPDPNQQDFITKLFGNIEKLKSLPQEEKEKLNKKIHTLPPAKKREALLAMGYKNIKAIDIADALGMTVAQFNNIMNVNEGDI
jgi:hypothetical protein